MGDLILRRRTILSLGNQEVYEIILGDAFLMSSLFTEVEVALAELGMAAAADAFPGEDLDVVVGGLGLGYTARETLRHPKLHSLIVVDYLEAVIEWHRDGLVPLGPELTGDPRCRLEHGDFFKLALADAAEGSFDRLDPKRRFHAVLLDIDHSPSNLLHDRHGAFYSEDGLRKLADRIYPGGVFGLWSDDPPDDSFLATLGEVFSSCASQVVNFHNPLRDCESSSTVYLAKTRRG